MIPAAGITPAAGEFPPPIYSLPISLDTPWSGEVSDTRARVVITNLMLQFGCRLGLLPEGEPLGTGRRWFTAVMASCRFRHVFRA